MTKTNNGKRDFGKGFYLSDSFDDAKKRKEGMHEVVIKSSQQHLLLIYRKARSLAVEPANMEDADDQINEFLGLVDGWESLNCRQTWASGNLDEDKFQSGHPKNKSEGKCGQSRCW